MQYRLRIAPGVALLQDQTRLGLDCGCGALALPRTFAGYLLQLFQMFYKQRIATRQ